MAPDPGRAYTVSCAAAKAVPDAGYLEKIEDAVRRVHRCTFAATELLNLYVRDRIENHNAKGLERLFEANWLLGAFNCVSSSVRKGKVDEKLQCVFDQYMGDCQKTDRKGLTEILQYECINLAALGSTNVWLHFQKRVLAFARTSLAMTEEAYKQLSKDELRARKLAIMQAASDVCRKDSEDKRSPEAYHEWVDATRARLGIDAAVGAWDDKPLLYHLKAKAHKFLAAMHLMSTERMEAGRKAFALFPLRRSHVPRHVRFDKKALSDLLGLKRGRLEKLPDCAGRAPKRKRNDPSLLDEKAAVFTKVLDLRAARVHRRGHFAFSFTTDGVSLHLGMERPVRTKSKTPASKTTMPTRGIHAIDALKQFTREAVRENGGAPVHAIGIDPGKVELLVCVDQDDPRKKPVQRYTLGQRRSHLCTRRYADELAKSRPDSVTATEEDLSKQNSKTPSLQDFAAFAARRRHLLAKCPEVDAFYGGPEHRKRRRKTRIHTQKSEADLVKRIKSMHSKDDERPLVLAYGAWGLVAGRPNTVGNKGNPPAIGVGLMKRLALHFVVAPTPEHFTSKTCAECGCLCGPHPTLKHKDKHKDKHDKDKEIRGLRVCQNEGCGVMWNRDKLGARNIGLQFTHLLTDKGPIRPMTKEELEFHDLDVCLECA